MNSNIGLTDKMVRLVAAAGLAMVGLQTQSMIGLLALVPVATVVLSWDPLYNMIGFSTNRENKVA